MKNLAQVFDNNSNCYARHEDVVLAMDQEAFVKTVTILLKEKSDSYDRLKAAFDEVYVQLEYLNNKFQKTGTSEALLSRYRELFEAGLPPEKGEQEG